MSTDSLGEASSTPQAFSTPIARAYPIINLQVSYHFSIQTYPNLFPRRQGKCLITSRSLGSSLLVALISVYILILSVNPIA